MAAPKSIEELLKKPAAPGVSTTPTDASASTPPPTAAPTKAKPKKAAAPTMAGELVEKMDEIRLAELEREAAVHAQQVGLPFIDLKGFPITPEALSLVPKAEATDLHAIPFFYANDEIRIATTEPGPAVDALVKRVKEERHANVELYFVSQQSYEAAYKLYAILPEVKEIIFGYRIEEADLKKYEQEIGDLKQLQERISKVSTTDIVTLMMGAALRSGASDVHVEAEEEQVKIRFRIDGILNEAATLPKTAWKQMIARLKLLAGVKMNIDDIPQDGRITIYLTNEKIDIRVSFLPTAFGESVVMRILRPKAIALEFDNLGIRGLALERLQREVARPNGMIITTGPTGSGKTTSLYAILKKLNTPDVKIITLEDPIEYKLQGINQSQIEHTKNYDFAKGLRSILRQDPDVVMVGEIRDMETAEIAIQAALTGHLVVSTIHTNSAAGAVPRFLSMGVKPFLLAPALNALIGQRLVRRLCPDCKIPTEMSPSQAREVKQELARIPKNSGYSVDLAKLSFFGPGNKPDCPTCHGNGYKGRVGIYEIFTMSREIEETILSKEVTEGEIQDLAMKDGMLTMAQDGLLKALDGMTSVEEVLAAANVDTTVEEPVEEVKK